MQIIHHNEFSASSSILQMGNRHRDAFPHTQNAVDENISVCVLDEVAKDLELEGRVLAKIDVQGYELNVLLGAERTLPLIDILIIETSFEELYEGQPLFYDVHQFLHDRHFRYAGAFHQMFNPSDGAMLQEDSIFVNTRQAGGKRLVDGIVS